MTRGASAFAGIALLGAFAAIEGRLRQGQAARSRQPGKQDKGTTAAVGVSFGIASVAGPALGLWKRGRLPAGAGWLGVAVMAGGLALRVQAARTLGASYTRTLKTQEDQVVVDSGPYRYLRHPGYAGILAMWLGYGLAMTSAPAALITTAANVTTYLWRINAEEEMLADALGESYHSYQQRTSRLLPGIC